MIQRATYLRALILGATMCGGLVTVSLAPRVALAQTSKGTLTGVVRDSSGAIVVGAKVTASDVATGEVRATTTTSQGAYRLDALTPGQYTVHVESTGFEQFEATSLTVPPSLVVSYDIELKLGRLNETVSVSADNVLLDQENGSLSQTISGEALAKLPIFTLNPFEVLTTVPGVQLVSNTQFTNGVEIQVSGARPRANNFMIDGEEINDATIAGQAVQPNIPDMYSDVIVYTHNPPAEFGRASGGVANLITKGGTNTFHGSSWELYSGSGLNSTDGQERQLTPQSRSNKPRYDQHQFGFTAGGPVIKDKLFAFGAAQWSRYYGNETAQQVTLPNAAGVALLQTLAAGTGVTATNAALMLKYLSNASYLNTFADFGATAPAALGAACPASQPACVLGIDSFLRPATTEQNPDTQWTYRIDYTPWTKDTFTARYLHDRSSLTPDFFANGSSLPGFDTLQGGFSELGQGTWTHILSTHFLNEFRASETRLSFAFSPTAQTLANPLYNFPTIETPEIQNLGFDQTDFPQGRGQDMYQFQDTVSWTHGRHTLRAGADIGRRIEKDLNAIPVNGVLSFADGGNGSTGVGNFLLNQLGPSGTASRTFGNPDVDPHSWRSGIFAQDDFKFSPGLTLNLGVRWDYYTNPDNSLPYPAINPSSAATLYGPINTVYKVAGNKTHFAPRVGFAYTPRQGKWLADGKTVVRGGFGIFFDPEFTNITTNNADTAPNVAAGEIQQTNTVIGNATGLLATIKPQVSPFSTVESVVNNLTSPYSEEWNLGVERVLPGQIALSVTYVGSRGVKLFANQQYNYEDFNTGERLDPTRGVIIARGNFADSRYNGLEVGGKHNFSHGLAVTGSYVYSKSLDDGSDIFAPDSSPTSYSANLAPGGRHQDWGNSVFDHRQYAAFTYVWSPAGLHSESKGFDALLSGATRHWTISGASRFQSGAYANLNIYGLDTNGDGSVANDRPLLGSKSAPIDSVGIDGIYLGSPAVPGTYYDLAANNQTGAINPVTSSAVHWLIPYGPQFVSQEIGRNFFLTPGSLYNDIALEKAIPTRLLHLDRGQFVLRAEVQNLANHNNLNYPWLSSNDNYQNLDLLNVGTPVFLNSPAAREGSGSTDPSENRALRFWAKFTF
jgi:hypothetical protein